MSRHQLRKRQASIVFTASIIAAASATSAFAWQSPLKHRYMKPMQVCDQGVFYVGGAPKTTPFHAGPTPGINRGFIIGQMYVQFQIPMKSTSWPLIMVHGSGYTGACVQGTAGGNEGWSDYTVRNGIPTFVVDQPGRARSGFDKTVLHEVEYLIDTNPAAAKALMPTFGGNWGSNAWTNWFGHNEPSGSDVTNGQMIRHGAPAPQSNGQPAPGQDPLCATQPAHCQQLGRLPMEPEAPWAVDQAIASRTGNGAPAGLGTVTPDVNGHVNPNYPLNDRYLALDAYKFDVPNGEVTLPASTCATCVPTNVNSANTWTPKALAELVEGLGGGIIATHSQSGSMGHHATRILKEHGKLNLLKGLITIEGSCSLTGAGLTAADFVNIPYMAFKGDYTGTAADCQNSANLITAAGGKAEYVQLDQPGFWQGTYNGPYGADYVGPFAGVSHMMMIEDNPSPGKRGKKGKATNLQVMDVMLEWAKRNISTPRTAYCGEEDDSLGHDCGPNHDETCY